MTGFIDSVFPYPNRVSLKEAFEVLEPDDGKLSRPVLRGPGPSNGVRLLDLARASQLGSSCPPSVVNRRTHGNESNAILRRARRFCSCSATLRYYEQLFVTGLKGHPHFFVASAQAIRNERSPCILLNSQDF